MNKRNIILIIAFLAVILGFTVLNGYFLQKRLALEHAHEGVVDILKRARKLTVELGEPHVAFFMNSQAFVYKASDRDSRLKNVDLAEEDNIQIVSLNLVGGGTEVIFSGPSGTTENYGSLRVAFAKDPGSFKEVYISPSGEIDLSPEEREERLDEARDGWRDKCHADRINLRFPDAVTEEDSLVLDFGERGSLSVDIEPIIQENIWRGTITVSSEDQLIAFEKGESENQLILVRPDNLVNQPFAILFEGDEVARVSQNGTMTMGGNVLCKSEPTSLEEQLQ